MDLFNKWTILVLGIWLCNALAIIFKKKGDKDTDFGYALMATVLIGIGYLILKGH